jgi:hypothetical protein
LLHRPHADGVRARPGRKPVSRPLVKLRAAAGNDRVHTGM